MKLSAEELAQLTEQADRSGSNRSRTPHGGPGSRQQPLSYAALIAKRRAALNSNDG